jgi:acyl phosphate:glycerol-3-phosphate acyltransferase
MQAMLTAGVTAYLLGSIPFGYLLVRAFRGADIRTTGSGNIGATNVARTSPLLGLATLFLDMLKGLAAVELVSKIVPGNRMALFVAAFAAVLGHVFPIWLGFRGGKGVATGFAVFLMLTPRAVLFASGIFLAMALAFRFVSLASVTAAASLPVFAYVIEKVHSPGEISLLCAASLLIVLKHHANVRRLLAGAEPRFRIKRR